MHRKIVVNLNEPGYPGETIEEPHIPLARHHAKSEHSQSHLQHGNGGAPIYHNHRLSHKRSGESIVSAAVAHEETGAKRDLKLHRNHNNIETHDLRNIDDTTVSSKRVNSSYKESGAVNTRENHQQTESLKLHKDDVAKPNSWEIPILKNAFQRKSEYLNFMRKLQNDWNTLGRRNVIRQTRRRRSKTMKSLTIKRNELNKKHRGKA